MQTYYSHASPSDRMLIHKLLPVLKTRRTRSKARADGFRYVERFYNPTRCHSTFRYVSPTEFDKSQKA